MEQELTIDDLPIEQGGMIRIASDSHHWMLTSLEFPKAAFKPLIKLKIFREVGDVIEVTEVVPYTQTEYIRRYVCTEYQLTEYGYKLLCDGLERWYATNLAANVSNLWDDEPIQITQSQVFESMAAKTRKPYKTKKVREAEAKLARWNALASG